MKSSGESSLLEEAKVSDEDDLRSSASDSRVISHHGHAQSLAKKKHKIGIFQHPRLKSHRTHEADNDENSDGTESSSIDRCPSHFIYTFQTLPLNTWCIVVYTWPHFDGAFGVDWTHPSKTMQEPRRGRRQLCQLDWNASRKWLGVLVEELNKFRQTSKSRCKQRFRQRSRFQRLYSQARESCNDKR